MVSFAGQGERTLLLDGKRYFLAEPEDAHALDLETVWDTRLVRRQEGDPDDEFVIPIKNLKDGFGYSFAEQATVYDEADGWDLTSGRMKTWGQFATGESFTDVDRRGWLYYDTDGKYLYAMRGRYVVKYSPDDTPDGTWNILEFHQLGDDRAVANEPIKFEGKVYVPVWDTSTDPPTAALFHELATINTPVTEVQTVIISGSPTGGSYTLTFNDGITSQTTAAIAWNADSATVQAALRLLKGLQSITIAESGSSPNYTHTITMTAAPTVIATSSPPQLTSTDSLTGGTPNIAHATTVAGTGDQWELGPSGKEAIAFAMWDKPVGGPHLIRAEDNTVDSAATAPTTGGNWLGTQEVGDSTVPITSLAVLDSLLVVGKEDGPWTFDESGVARPEIPSLLHARDRENCVGMVEFNGSMLIPHRTGTILWRPGHWRYVGAGVDGQIEGDVSSTFGRDVDIVSWGRNAYVTVADRIAGTSYLQNLLAPGNWRGPLIPHMHQKYATLAEGVEVMTVGLQQEGPRSPSTLANESTVGTHQWQNPTNGTASDDLRAVTDGSTGVSEYLASSQHGFTIPTDATIKGFLLEVERRSSATQTNTGATIAGTGANDATTGDDAWTSPTNITADDGSDALRASNHGTTNFLKGTNLGFSVPSSATIDGIVAEIVDVDLDTQLGVSATDSPQIRDSAVATGSSATLSWPTVTAEPGDLVIACVGVAGDAGITTSDLPSTGVFVQDGWTVLGTQGESVENQAAALWATKSMRGDPVAAGDYQPAVTALPGSSDWTTALVVIKGAANAVTSFASTSQFANQPNFPDVTTGSGAHVRALNIGISYANAPFTAGSGWTEIEDSNGAQNQDCFIQHREMQPSSTYNTNDVGSQTGTNGWVGCTITISEVDAPRDVAVHIVKADASIGSEDKSSYTALTGTEQTLSYGSSSDLWGEAWTPTDINDSDFGFVAAWVTGDDSRINVDAYRVTVYYTDRDVKDSAVRMFKAGSPVGDSKADTVTEWPEADAIKRYGGSADLWGASWTVAEVNATGFGAGVAANVTSGLAEIDYMRLTVYYTPTGQSDVPFYLGVLVIDSTRQIATPTIYKLGRSVLGPADDPYAYNEVSDARIRLSRYALPSRNVQKVYRSVECYVELSQQGTGTPGVELWASVDDGTYFQLNDAAGAALTITADGAYEAFFPATSASIGRWVQLEVRVPATSGGEVPVAATVRDITIHGMLLPKTGDSFAGVIRLKQGVHRDGYTETRTPAHQLSDLRALVGPRGSSDTPIAYQDPITGDTGYLTITDLRYRPTTDKGASEIKEIAVVRMRAIPFA